MKTQKGINTRNSIVSAAAELFLKKPVDKVTVSDIIKKAKIAKGTFYIYFDSKDDLVWCFLEHELNEITKKFNMFDKLGFDESSIGNIVNFIINFTKEKFETLKMIHHFKFYNYLGLEKIKAYFDDEWISLIERWISIGKERGHFSVDDPEFTAKFILYAFHDMIDEMLMEHAAYTFDVFGEKLKKILIKLLF